MLIGPHLHQSPPARESDLLALRPTFAVTLDLDAAYYIPRMDHPGLTWLIRLYHPDMMSRRAEEVAGAVIVEAQKWRDQLRQRVVYQWSNEKALGVEHGNNPASGPYWDSDDGFRARLAWDLAVAKDVRRRAPWIQLAAPFETPGHQDIDGREEVRLYAESGFCDLIDFWGAHHYAEGPDQGGFDAPDKEWRADRVLKVRAMLNAAGYARLPIMVGECNRKMVDVGDTLGEFERYCERIQKAVHSVGWFIWSSGDPSFGDMALSRIPDVVPRFQRIIDRFKAPSNGGSSLPPAPDVPAPPAYEPQEAFIAAYQKHWGKAIGPLHYPMISVGPPQYQMCSQHFERGTAVWTGSHVRFVARGS